MENTFLPERSAVIQLDPRTKIYMLLIFNIIMLTSVTEGVSIYLKPVLAFLVFLALLNARKPKAAVIYLILYVISYNSGFFLHYVSGMSFLGFIIRFLSQMITRIVPGVMFAYSVLSTTKVSEFVASMERLHISQKLIIPFAVMFRFFPTIGEEYRSIQDAMRLRGIGFKRGPLAIVEYRLVPLIVSLVKIGNELSAAAVTRGLGSPVKRTNYCKIGFGICDMIALLIMTAILAIYFVL